VASAQPLTDHDQIRQWAEARKGRPACVKGTGGKGKNDVGMIRLDFPGFSGAKSLQKISWDEWFQRFDDSNLALIVQDTTARGQKSNFNKLVARDGAEQRPARAAGSSSRAASSAGSARKTGQSRQTRQTRQTTKGGSRAAAGSAGRTTTAARGKRSASAATRKRATASGSSGQTSGSSKQTRRSSKQTRGSSKQTRGGSGQTGRSSSKKR
jgi:hypothetical protein